MRRRAIRARTWAKGPACAALGLLAALPASAEAVTYLDRSFGEDGIVVSDVNDHGYDDLTVVNGAVVQPDGKVIATGHTGTDPASPGWAPFDAVPAIARYLPDGSLDPAFGNSGIVSPGSGSPGSGGASASPVLLPDGKLLVRGSTFSAESEDPPEIMIARHLADGSLDPTFGDGGVVTTPLGPYGAGSSDMIVLDGGKILVSGAERGDPAQEIPSVPVLIRYTPSGALDQAFGDGGVVDVRHGGSDMIAVGEGRVVLADSFETSRGDPAFRLARYLPDGSLDLGFGEGGVAQVRFRGLEHGRVRQIALAHDGKLVVLGSAEKWNASDGRYDDYVALARFLPHGRVDRSFADDGREVILEDRIFPPGTLLVQRSGAILLAGHTSGFGGEGPGGFGIARFRPGGGIDRSFGEGGLVVTPIGYWNIASDMRLYPGRRLILAGDTCLAGAPDRHACRFALTRYRLPATGRLRIEGVSVRRGRIIVRGRVNSSAGSVRATAKLVRTLDVKRPRHKVRAARSGAVRSGSFGPLDLPACRPGRWRVTMRFAGIEQVTADSARWPQLVQVSRRQARRC